MAYTREPFDVLLAGVLGNGENACAALLSHGWLWWPRLGLGGGKRPLVGP